MISLNDFLYIDDKESIRLGGPAHRIVTKTVHKTLPRGDGVQRVGGWLGGGGVQEVVGVQGVVGVQVFYIFCISIITLVNDSQEKIKIQKMQEVPILTYYCPSIDTGCRYFGCFILFFIKSLVNNSLFTTNIFGYLTKK